MSFFQELQVATQDARAALLQTPLVEDALAGVISRETYAAYLCQAYHHVKHTVPLLMATGSRLPQDREWLRDAIAEYIEEERGHQEWILNDIEAVGFEPRVVRDSVPAMATELLVSYAYDTVQRVSPVGFFGMVHVLEGTSIALADRAAAAIQSALQLPDAAFSYLRSHGALDQDHVKFFASLMDRIQTRTEQLQIIHHARVFYKLFGDVLSGVDAACAPLVPLGRSNEHAA